MMDKKEVRKILLTRRKEFFHKSGVAASEKIFRNLIDLPCVQKADTILSYASYGTEVITKQMNEYILSQGKGLYLPITNCKMNCIEFHKVISLQDLVPGFHGIPEPKPSAPCWNFKGENTCIIVPGVGFDKFKHRMGYGGGYYDRFLQNQSTIPTVMVAYSAEYYEMIPTEKTDQNIDYIITEQESIL